MVQKQSRILTTSNIYIWEEDIQVQELIQHQFDFLIDQGIITVDHLIKRNAKGRVSEKGPLFKIKPAGIELLFPPSESYKLI